MNYAAQRAAALTLLTSHPTTLNRNSGNFSASLRSIPQRCLKPKRTGFQCYWKKQVCLHIPKVNGVAKLPEGCANDSQAGGPSERIDPW